MPDFDDVIRASLGLPPKVVPPEPTIPENEEDFGLPNTIQDVEQFVEEPVKEVPVAPDTSGARFIEGIQQGAAEGLAAQPVVQSASVGESTKQSGRFAISEPVIAPGSDVDVKGAAQRARALHKGIKGGLEQQAKGIQNQADAERALAINQAELLQQQAQQQQEDLQAEQIAQQEAQMQTEVSMANISAAVEQMAAMKIDPARLWNDPSRGNRTAGMAAAFIGGFLTTGGVQNNIQAIIDKQIDRDINAQATDIKVASANIKNLAMLHKLGVEARAGDAKDRALQRILRRNAVVTKMKSEAMRFQDPILQAKAQQAIGQLETRNQQEFAKLFQITFAQKAQEARLKQSRILGQRRLAIAGMNARTSRMGVKLAREKFEHGKTVKQGPTFFIPGERTGLRTNGQNGFQATSEKERTKVADKVIEANNQYENLEFAKKLAIGRIGIPGSEARKRFVAQMARIQLKAAEAIKGNASDRDLKIVRDTHGGSFDKFFRLASADTIKRVINDSQKNLVDGMENFTGTLSRDPRINVTWVPPKVKEEDDRLLSISSFSDMALNVKKNRKAKAGTEGFSNLNGVVNEMEDQLKKFSIASNPFEAPAAQKAINELFKIPSSRRRMLVNGVWHDDVALHLQSLLEANKSRSTKVDPNLTPKERVSRKAADILKQLQGK